MASGRHSHRAMVVAVITVRMMKVTIHQVVRVVTVRHRFVPAAGPVPVTSVVTAAVVFRRALFRVLRSHSQRVLIHVITVHVVQVPVVQVIRVALVLYGGVAAARPMLVRMLGMGFAVAHRNLLVRSLPKFGPRSRCHHT